MAQFPNCESYLFFLYHFMVSYLSLYLFKDHRPQLHSQKIFQKVSIDLAFALALDALHYVVKNLNLLCSLQYFLQVLMVFLPTPQE